MDGGRHRPTHVGGFSRVCWVVRLVRGNGELKTVWRVGLHLGLQFTPAIVLGRNELCIGIYELAMEWVVDQSIFQDVTTHGNTNWVAKDLVMLAVLWVWSEKSQLTGAFKKHPFGRSDYWIVYPWAAIKR